MSLALAAFLCLSPVVVDGDTLRCKRQRIRIAAIDAPEMAGCKPNRRCVRGSGLSSKRHLQRLIGSASVHVRPIDYDDYGRTVACVSVNGRDISNAMVAAGFAIERYRRLSECR